MSDTTEAPEHTAGPFDAALGQLIRDVEAAQAEEEAARKAMEAARRRRIEIAAAVDRMANLLPLNQRRGWLVRLAYAEGRAKTRRRTREAQDRQGRILAIKQWLVSLDLDHFGTAELTAHLDRRGFTLPPRYVANTCRLLEGQGYLRRITRGRYAVNRMHPELVEMHLAWMDRKLRELGIRGGGEQQAKRLRVPPDASI